MKTKYNTQVMEVEQGTFTPIVLTIKGVMAPEASRFHKTLAEKLATETGERYEEVTRLIRVKLSFLVLRASLLCLRGSRSLNNNDNGEACEDFALTLHEVGLRWFPHRHLPIPEQLKFQMPFWGIIFVYTELLYS